MIHLLSIAFAFNHRNALATHLHRLVASRTLNSRQDSSWVRQLFQQAKSSVPHSSYSSTKMQQNSEWSHWSIPVWSAARLADTYLSWSFFSMSLWDLMLSLMEGSWMGWVEVDCLSSHLFIGFSFTKIHYLLVCFCHLFKLASMMCFVKCCSSTLPSSI